MKKTLLSSIAAIATSTIAFAGAGIFDDFAIVNTTSASFYDLGVATGNPDFQGASLGSFNATTDNLQLGGQTKTFKNESTDVFGGQLFYRVWETSGGETGTFNQFNYSFQANLAGSNQQWGSDANGAVGTAFYTSNLLSGLSAGDYTLEVYTRITTNGVDAPSEIFSTNGGANFEATFTVVPEPSAFALLAGLLGLTYVALRRR